MPIFAHLDHEEFLQVNDRTRIDASKTFITANESDGFSNLTIKPGSDSYAIQVYDSNPKDRFLDWEFGSFKIDVDSTNNKIDFNEGASDLAATLTSGTYSLSGLATEIQTQLNSAGSHTYTVAVDADDKISISADGVFDLLLEGTNKNNLITTQLFFDEEDLTRKTSYTSQRVECLTRKITVVAGDNQYQAQTVTTRANTANVLSGTYFFLNAANDETKYYVYYGADPGLSGYTGISYTVSSGDTAAQVATAVASAVNASADFAASATNAIVTITNSDIGFATPASEGSGSGFTFAVTEYGQTQVSENSYIKIYSVLGDRLFSKDSDLEDREPEIRRWVKDGRNTFLNVHRAAQKNILEWLDREGFVNIYEDKFTKWDLVDITEVSEWAKYMALRLIFEGIKNATDDVFTQKRKQYESEEIAARQRSILRLDVDKSGDLEDGEGEDTNSVSLYFR